MKFKAAMFSKFKKIFIKIEHVLLVVLVIFSASFMYKAKDAKAITQTTFTGSCGMVANFNINGWEATMMAHNGTAFTKSVLGTFNFDTGKVAMELTVVDSYGELNTVTERTIKNVGMLAVLSGFDAETGIYEYTITDPNTNSTLKVKILPVNSGNTFLMSGYAGLRGLDRGAGISGVCQKI